MTKTKSYADWNKNLPSLPQPPIIIAGIKLIYLRRIFYRKRNAQVFLVDMKTMAVDRESHSPLSLCHFFLP